MNLPIKAKISGEAQSAYNRATIQRRLDILRRLPSFTMKEEEEIRFLQSLLERTPD